MENVNPRLPGQPILGLQLTKKALFDLPTGLYITCNCHDRMRQPVVAATVPDGDEQREALWKMIRERSVTGRLFYAFTSVEDYLIYYCCLPIPRSIH